MGKVAEGCEPTRWAGTRAIAELDELGYLGQREPEALRCLDKPEPRNRSLGIQPVYTDAAFRPGQQPAALVVAQGLHMYAGCRCDLARAQAATHRSVRTARRSIRLTDQTINLYQGTECKPQVHSFADAVRREEYFVDALRVKTIGVRNVLRGRPISH